MPFRAARSTRSGRPGAPNDADVFDGLPVRQWRRHEQTIGIVEEDQPANEGPQAQGPLARDVSPEPPMPKGSEYYTPWCRELLRLARSGKLPQKTNKASNGDAEPKRASSDKENSGQPSSDDKDVDAAFGHRGTKRPAEQGFPALRWGLVPRQLEEPERERLAKRRKGLPPLHATVHVDSTAPMRKTKVKRTDAEGQSTVFEVMVREDQTVEGEIKEEITLENAGAAIAAPKPGTFVEGLGVTNEQGVVVASEGIAPLRRKGPAVIRRRRKKGPGRWQQRLSDMTTGGVSASAEALEERKRKQQEASREVAGQADEDKEEQHDAEDDDEAESGDDAEEGDDDDDREEGELTPDGKQDADADDSMLLDEDIPPPSEAPQKTQTVRDENAAASNTASTVPVETGELQKPQIPGLTSLSDQNVTDAAKDVHDEPAPERNVAQAFETSTSEDQEKPSNRSQRGKSPDEPSETMKDLVTAPTTELHRPTAIPNAADASMQDVGLGTIPAGDPEPISDSTSVLTRDITTGQPSAEINSPGQVVAHDATTLQPPELSSVPDNETLDRPISPSKNNPVPTATTDTRPLGSNEEGRGLDNSRHTAVDGALVNVAGAQVLHQAVIDQGRDVSTPNPSGLPAASDGHDPTGPGADQHDGSDGGSGAFSSRAQLARRAPERIATIAASDHHGSGTSVSSIDAGNGGLRLSESDAVDTPYQPHPEDIPFLPHETQAQTQTQTSHPTHPEDIPFIPPTAYDTTAPISNSTNPPITTTSAETVTTDPPAPPTQPNPSHPPPPPSFIGTNKGTSPPSASFGSVSSRSQSLSPQRPEMEALTPEPEGTQQGDLYFEDGDVDLLGSAEGDEG